MYNNNLNCVWGYTVVEIMLELKKNILKFGYGINYKYEGMLSHSFDRFYGGNLNLNYQK